jgi:uncharacterized protein (TIGR02598 family)
MSKKWTSSKWIALKTPGLGSCFQFIAPRGSGREGFSLIEVVLAIGIISFAMIPLLGLMPVGVSMSRSASSDIALGLIRKDLTATFRNVGFSNLALVDSNNVFYSESFYSESGERVESGDPFAIYKAKLKSNTPANFNSKANRLLFTIFKNGQSNSVLAIIFPDDGT